MLLILIGVAILFLTDVETIIPRICAPNATLPNAICCPSLSPNGVPCGGPVRGACKRITPYRLNSTNKYHPLLSNDDRHDWPLAFFQFSCHCNTKFTGVGCEKCFPGFVGSDCSETKQPRIRKNFQNLTAQERERFRVLLNKTKSIMSTTYMGLNVTSSLTSDPTNISNIQLYNITIYNLYVFMHFYAARSTMLNKVDSNATQCGEFANQLNFAHKGPAFFTWHRYYLLLFEEDLAKIAELIYGRNISSQFGLPYWDWVNETDCRSVCYKDGLGSVESPVDTPELSGWRPICPRIVDDYGCHICDAGEPELSHPLLWREVTTLPSVGLPTQHEIDQLLLISKFDFSPYDSSSFSKFSFRNLAEGFLRYTGPDDNLRSSFSFQTNDTSAMFHNLVHKWLNGTWLDVATSPNDPIFFVHHCFVDKIFELWLQKYGIQNLEYPNNDLANIGHGLHDYIVPFIPLITNYDIFKISTELGFEYDNRYLGNNYVIKFHDGRHNGILLSTILILVSIFVVIVIVLIICIRYNRMNEKLESEYKLLVDPGYHGDGGEEGDEKKPLI